MSKRPRSDHSIRSKSPDSRPAAREPNEAARARREAVESIVIAIVLAFLFRAFEAEAFVIPTGSMAPTLQGRHKDVTCPECDYRYQAGASIDSERQSGQVVAVTCPMCFYTEEMDPRKWSHNSHTGDRILVNKFAYEPPFGDPKRWDVIVFKYPGNAKQNYIKRLVGVENETIKIRHGDVFSVADADVANDPTQFKILRKPPAKLPYLLQPVHDTKHVSEALKQADWPLNWQQPGSNGANWSSPDQGTSYACQATDETSWLNFRKYFVDFETWEALATTTEDVTPKIVPITDFYAYNAQSRSLPAYMHGGQRGTSHPTCLGYHWVGDLALEAWADVESDTGSLSIDLVEAGRHHVCEIDLATGQAKLSISDQTVFFQSVDGERTATQQPTAATAIRGRGRYRVRFANVDNQLLLWVNKKLCKFDGPTTYSPTPHDRPVTTPSDPGDLEPARLGVTGAQVQLTRLRLLRDVYYVATSHESRPTDYRHGYERAVYQFLLSPQTWKPGDLFDARGEVVFTLLEDQYFALGDNSPFSKDSRLWGRDQHFVERDMLIGKAVMIYWPHPWRVGIPGTEFSIGLIPNVADMGLIR